MLRVDIRIARPVGDAASRVEQLVELEPVGGGEAQEEQTAQQLQMRLEPGGDERAFFTDADGAIQVVGDADGDHGDDQAEEEPLQQQLVEREAKEVEAEVLAEDRLADAKAAGVEELQEGQPGVGGPQAHDHPKDQHQDRRRPRPGGVRSVEQLLERGGRPFAFDRPGRAG